MKLHNPTAEIFVPDGKPVADALRRCTHIGIGAHQDDLEFMAFHGILQCFHSDTQWFGGVTCTNGSGSARTGPYANYTDAQMMAVRRKEQNDAAVVGKYGAMVQLDYPSSAVKSATDTMLKNDLKQILAATSASVVYTHNPADKHDTHIGVVIATLQAIRELPKEKRPQKVYGCEVWRNLDWMIDSEKVVLDVSTHENLAAALNGIFDSQIAGGKRYDLATMGRRRANATFFESHATDKAEQLIFAMDLSPLATNDSLDIIEYVTGYIDSFRRDVVHKLGKRSGKV
ncbi:MAG: PIG-L family deacetylase [Verrucomicrobiae bacterium]|nr:PIG-L family deacetylase [Verrucomicrobiae bacterium]